MAVINRAMTGAQKEARRAEILKVAMGRFALTSYATLSMADIARQAGVAKGTLYLYFHSKEEMFLALCEEELADWFAALDTALEQRRADMSIAGLVQLFAESIATRPYLLRLLAILHTVLEQNVDHDTALRFKTFLRERLLKTGALLEGYLRFLAPGQGVEVLLKIDALVIGLQHLAEPSEVMRAVLAQPEMAMFRVDLQQQMLDTMKILLMGLAYEAKYKQT